MSRGRLIKKSDQHLLESAQVTAYPWKEFSPESILLADNPRKSLVIAKTHSPQELKKKVQTPPEFEQTFGAPSKTLFPQDLTAEFSASQKEMRQRRRLMQLDEQESVALELSGLELEEEDDQRNERSHSQQRKDSESTGQENAGAAASRHPNVRTASADISDLSALSGKNNKSLSSRGLDFALNEYTQEERDAEVNAAFERGLLQGRQEGDALGYHRGLEESAHARSQVSHDEETKDQEQSPSSLDEQRYMEGLQAGIEQGRADALLEAEQKYQHSMLIFTKALSELQHLKTELLSTGRAIFSEIVQMCADKILRKHIQWNDEALRGVFSAAMSQFQAQDELKIEMHPDDVARLEPHLSGEQPSRLRFISNPKMAQGDIKIEANHEVVSFDIQKTVETVIESLKDEIFDDKNKDDSPEEAV